MNKRVILIGWCLLGWAIYMPAFSQENKVSKKYEVIPDSFSEIFLFENVTTKTGKIRTLRLKITTNKEDISRIKAKKSSIMNTLQIIFSEEKKETILQNKDKRKEMEEYLKAMIKRISKSTEIYELEILMN
jgi:hypothetical protein